LAAHTQEHTVPDTLPPTAVRRTARSLYRRARWQHWLGRPEQALDLCRRAVEQTDYSRAYTLMSRLTLPGEDYLAVLARMHRHLQPRTYLEIGVAHGQSLALALPQTQAIGVDPEPKLREQPGPGQRIFALTSDEFFARHDVRREFGGAALDMAFIDGMHRFEFALRDFINVEKSCSASSVILMHDCYPLDARTAQRERATGFWSGDIWRLVLLLREVRPDLIVRTIGTPPTGLGLVLNPDPASTVLSERLKALTQTYLAMDFSVLAGRQPQALGLVANDWEQVRALLDARARGG
jgi:hypothetical protein